MGERTERKILHECAQRPHSVGRSGRRTEFMLRVGSTIPWRSPEWKEDKVHAQTCALLA